MRIPTILFILYELADVLTTAVGMHIGLTEVNPIANAYGWGWIILIKFIGVLIVCIFLQLKKPKKIDIIYTLALAPFVIWNAFQLLLTW